MERSALFGCRISTDMLALKFFQGGSLIPKFYPKTVADVWPMVSRVMVRERGPDFKFPGTSRCGKYFPGSSGILLSRGIPNFYGGRTFSSSRFRI